MKKTFEGKAIDGEEFTINRLQLIHNAYFAVSLNQNESTDIENIGSQIYENGPYLKKYHLIYLFCILAHSRNFNQFWNIIRNNIK